MPPASVTRRPATLAELAEICQWGRTDGRIRTQATTHTELDQALPGGGWPIGALTELMPAMPGIGELQLVTPALASLTRNDRYIAFIDPPFLPYPPALAQHGLKLEHVVLLQNQPADLALWAAEQMLRCTAFGAVLMWSTTLAALPDKNLRRLQLAAETGGSMAVLYRSLHSAALPSPAALRLCLFANKRGLSIEIKKCRGGRAGKTVQCLLAPAVA